ncbi:MAG: hypothetical protein GY943_28565 [Chloroflexi bacterium]|nr:hypothetical protein [Chloroflexota bacterium]
MKDDYQAYLLRFQRGEGQAHWRVYMENAVSGENRHFATEQELLRFLMHALAIMPDQANTDLTYTQELINEQYPSL